MRVRSSSKLFLTPCAAGVLLSLGACGGDKDGPKVIIPPDRDSGADMDASSGDAEAGLPVPADTGVLDATVPSEGDDGGPSEPFDPSEDCKVVEERSELSLPVKFGDETGFAITPGLTGFGVAYQSDNCGALGTLPVASVGEYPEPKKIFTSCDTVAQGVSLLHHRDGYRLTWVDNYSGSAELQTLQLTEALAAPAEPTRSALTNNLTRELVPVQASIVGSDYLSWINQDGAARAILLRAATATEPRTLIAGEAEYAPVRLALAQIGTSSGALAFVSEEKKKGVWLIPLSDGGEARSEPVQLTASVSTGNSVDLATREEDGGAVVYSLDLAGRAEVRFRRLNREGLIQGDEAKIVTFPLQGRDASISRLGGGYVVAFRSVNAGNPARGEVRVTFITKEGNVQRDSAGLVTSHVVAEASTTGGRVTARVSQDGQLLIGFLDAGEGEEGPRFRLVRKRLDCAL